MVPTIALVCMAVVAFTPGEWWLRLALMGIFALGAFPAVWAWAYRVYCGGEETPTNVAITQEGIFIDAIPLHDVPDVIARSLSAYSRRRRPLPRPIGEVRGTPANTADLFEKATAALPETIEITEEPPKPPDDAARLQ